MDKKYTWHECLFGAVFSLALQLKLIGWLKIAPFPFCKPSNLAWNRQNYPQTTYFNIFSKNEVSHPSWKCKNNAKMVCRAQLDIEKQFAVWIAITCNDDGPCNLHSILNFYIFRFLATFPLNYIDFNNLM